MKDIRNYIILGLLVIVALFVFKSCNGGEKEKEAKVQAERDSLHKKVAMLEARMKQYSINIEVYKRLQASSEKKTDSLDAKLKESKQSYYTLSKKVRNGLTFTKCDSVEIETVLNECDSVIADADRTIAQRDTTISILKANNKEQADMVAAARELLKSKDNEIEILDKELKRVKRRNKIKTALIIIADVVKDGLIIIGLRG